MIDKYLLDDLRLRSDEKGELARWVIQLQSDLDDERRKSSANQALLAKLEAAFVVINSNNAGDSESTTLMNVASYANGLAQKVRQLEMALSAPQKRMAELDKSETQLINERDHAESTVNSMFAAVMGESPEWSSMYQFIDAVDEVEDFVSILKQRAESAENESCLLAAQLEIATERSGINFDRADKAEAALSAANEKLLVPSDSDIIRDANRYRFLRDEDAWGEDSDSWDVKTRTGLISSENLMELRLDSFDAAIDARMAASDIQFLNPVTSVLSAEDSKWKLFSADFTVGGNADAE
ncbi:TPA: hypothetical protein PXO92_002711 [Yersinia enterocolitica]|nr:hypothetical protein [Yersinia enterocolitica]